MAGFEGILYLALLVLFAKLFEEVAVRLRQPPIVGYILAGIVVGPALLAWVQPADEISLFIQLGVFFLFFLIGLEEIDIPSIFSVLRKRLFAGATVGFAIPFALAVPVLLYMTDLAPTPVLAVASVIGISSLGVVAKILMDYGKLKEPLGLEIFTLTAVLEFIGIIVASAFIQLAEPGGSFFQAVNDAVVTPPLLTGSNGTAATVPPPAAAAEPAFDVVSFVWLFIRMVIFFAAITLFGLKGLPPLMRFVRSHLKVREINFGLLIGIILLVSYFAEASGVHGAIGALLLGVLFSQMPKKDYEDAVKGMHSIAHGVFIPIFFAGIGIYFSFGFLSLPYLLIAAVLAVVTVGKFGGAIAAAAVAKLRPVLTVGTGVMAKGAVDLAILLSLLSAGIVNAELFSLITFGIVIMILATSLSLKKGIVSALPAQDQIAKEISMETAADTLTPLYTRMALGELRVRDVYTEHPPMVYGEIPVSEFAEKHLDQSHPAYVVATKMDKSYLGIVTPEQTRKIRKDTWNSVIVNDIAMQNIRAVKLGDPLYEVIEYMAIHDLDLLAVVSDDDIRVVGGIMREDVLRFISKEA